MKCAETIQDRSGQPA